MKQAEIKVLSTEELKAKIQDLQSAYQQLKLTHAIAPIENPVQLRIQRRTLARLFTELMNRALQAVK